eukprot:8352489-Alexandrium_andersonii.AAC.1
MSASLVGSEMCIRDSRMTEPVPKPPNSTRNNGNGDATQTVCNAFIATSVSYTHLTLPTICSV